MKYAENITELIGNTPLVRLGRVAKHVKPLILAKVEYLNPAGSVKDRIALALIAEAEASGALVAGGRIVEPTSGNTGASLAMVAAIRGYETTFVTPEKVSVDKRNALKAYGSEVVVTPTTAPPDSPDSYYAVSDRLGREPGSYKPDQFSNQAGPRAHYATTGPEIWRDTEGKVTHVVMGAGTGGTISGVGRYLHEASAGKVQVVGADPAGSIYAPEHGAKAQKHGASDRSHDDIHGYYVEGVGEDYIPESYDASVPDQFITVDDSEAFAMTRRLAREEGLLVGGSSGLAVAAALRLAEGLSDDDVIVVVLPDSGRGYLGTIFNDTWMHSHGYLSSEGTGGAVAARGDVVKHHDTVRQYEESAQEIARANGRLWPDTPSLTPDTPVASAWQLIRSTGYATLPITTRTHPYTTFDVSGCISRDLVAAHLRTDPDVTVGDLAGEARWLCCAATASGNEVQSKLAEAEAVLLMDHGRPLGILDAEDIMSYGVKGHTHH